MMTDNYTAINDIDRKERATENIEKCIFCNTCITNSTSRYKICVRCDDELSSTYSSFDDLPDTPSMEDDSNDVHALRDESSSLIGDESPTGICITCLSSRIQTVFIPCGHASLCLSCSKRLISSLKCPICNLEIERVNRLFLS